MAELSLPSHKSVSSDSEGDKTIDSRDGLNSIASVQVVSHIMHCLYIQMYILNFVSITENNRSCKKNNRLEIRELKNRIMGQSLSIFSQGLQSMM